MLKRNVNVLLFSESSDKWEQISRWWALDLLGPVVYAIRLDEGIIKIGYTTKLAEREVCLRTQGKRSKSSQVVGIMFGDYDDEQRIHADLKPHLAHGREWYHPTPEVLAVVNEMRDHFNLPHIAA